MPVAELVPELARSVGLLNAATVHGGYRVVTASGRELSGDNGLIVQGVGGAYQLSTVANTVATLTGNTGSVSLRDTGGLVLGSLTLSGGVTARLPFDSRIIRSCCPCCTYSDL